MVILRTGTLENVRRQAQERLDDGFIGFDSRDYLGAAKLRHKRRIGVGLIDGRRDGIVFTSMDQDFRKNSASALNISLNSVSEPVLVVVQEEQERALSAWQAGCARTTPTATGGSISRFFLIRRRVRQRVGQHEEQPYSNHVAAINSAIRDLLALFRRSSYRRLHGDAIREHLHRARPRRLKCWATTSSRVTSSTC